MKLCRAWPEYCSSNSKIVNEPETQFFPKNLVESQVMESLQESINKVIKNVVIEEDPEPVRKPEATAVPAAAVSAALAAPATVAPVAPVGPSAPRELRDVWIFLAVFSIIFILLLSSLYNRISLLEKVIFESRV
jgi:hypothetical protein